MEDRQSTCEGRTRCPGSEASVDFRPGYVEANNPHTEAPLYPEACGDFALCVERRVEQRLCRRQQDVPSSRKHLSQAAGQIRRPDLRGRIALPDCRPHGFQVDLEPGATIESAAFSFRPGEPSEL